jgi:hypothetical protein
MDKARTRALLAAERRRLDELSRAVSRDHDDVVAGSSHKDPADDADRRLAEETTEALGEWLRDRWGALERRRLAWRRAPAVPRCSAVDPFRTSGWRRFRWLSRPSTRRPNRTGT